MSGLKNKLRIYIVDDHRIVLDGLESLLNREEDMTVCGVSEDAAEAIANFDKLNPDVAIIDIGLRKSINGIELTRAIHARYPDIKCLVLSQSDEEIYSERAIRAGALGYVMKSEATKTLVSAIRHIMGGGIYLSENMKSKILMDVLHNRPGKTGPLDMLSDRELEIFMLMGEGYKASDIAKKLQVSVKTIDTHRFHIKEKFNLRSVSDVMKYAIEWSKSN
ncbi:MAG: response regulator transcription factor [Spirochaetes bacterium]|nr:response regulator transcription factor [Spirochaetota bacterium]